MNWCLGNKDNSKLIIFVEIFNFFLKNVIDEILMEYWR